jgi:hypothetical protein
MTGMKMSLLALPLISTIALAQGTGIDCTLGMAPPPEAVVLFDGTDLDAWVRQGTDETLEWELVDEAMQVGGGSATTADHFEDCQLHLEFWVPHMPEAEGQGRGNSGVYLQGSYEVQVLDSYGIPQDELQLGDCGAIYETAIPPVNACKAPETWQTYDIFFRAPRFDDAGELAEPALMTVYHNGILIHERVEVPAPTRAAMPRDVTQPGPIMLQDHGNPVRYRNIWLVPMTYGPDLEPTG